MLHDVRFQMSSNKVQECEKEIDKAYDSNPLNEISYSQALWTILSVVEDNFLKFTYIDTLSSEQKHVHVDVYLNALTYPLRSIIRNNKNPSTKIKHEVINDHYGFAVDWLEKSEIYNNFCSIFPLWRNKLIDLTTEDNVLNTSDYKNKEIAYEVYNRLNRKDGAIGDKSIDPNNLVSAIMDNVSCTDNRFKLNITPKLSRLLIENYSSVSHERYKFPDDWKFDKFTLGEYKKVFIALQSLLYGRFIAKTMLAMNGMKGLGYPDSVWVLSGIELATRLSRYTSVKHETIEFIIAYLTFGDVGVRSPDIAVQPIVDLKNGYLALSPFVFINSDAERNLSVLLNQVGNDRKLYSKLTQQKEDVLRDLLKNEIDPLGYEVISGKLVDTDLDFAIIDRKEKLCIAFELKWFIEPAEIREVIQRSEELQKGVVQALKLMAKFEENNEELLDNLLHIDREYTFKVAVGSRNWIGYFDVQNPLVPIIKIRHFIDELKHRKNLKSTVKWLEEREYLPKNLVDYEIIDMPLELGSWKSSWYGIKPLT